MLQDMEVPGKPLPAPRQGQERKYVYERDLPCRLIISRLQSPTEKERYKQAFIVNHIAMTLRSIRP